MIATSGEIKIKKTRSTPPIVKKSTIRNVFNYAYLNILMKNSPTYERWNKKKIKEFHKILNKQFGFQGQLDYIFLEKKDKIYISSKEIDKTSLEKLNINTIGLYFATREGSGIRLSIEGSQVIGSECTENILELEDPTDWLQGKDIPTTKEFKGIVLIKYKKDFLGSGIYKEHRIINCVPKSRRVRTVK